MIPCGLFVLFALNSLGIWLLRSVFTVIGNPQPLYYKNNAMHEQQTQIIISSQGLNVKEQESMASLIWGQAKSIFTWREEGLYEEAKRLYPFDTTTKSFLTLHFGELVNP